MSNGHIHLLHKNLRCIFLEVHVSKKLVLQKFYLNMGKEKVPN